MRRAIPWEALAPLCLVALILAASPDLRSFMVNPDEGFTLMKARLLRCGFPLYSSVWCDQPPLYTYLTAGAFELFGENATAGRLPTVASSALLVLSVGHLVRLWHGPLHAVVAGAFVVLLPSYLMLSAAAMAGLPAIAFGMAALAAAARWRLTGRRPWLVGSAFLLAASVLIKLFTLPLALLVAGGLVVDAVARRERPRRWSSLLAPALAWTGTFLLVAGGLAWSVIGPSGLDQLVTPHVLARSNPAYRDSSSSTLMNCLEPSQGLLVLAALGALLAVARRQWCSLPFIGATVVGLLALAGHAPVWPHHSLLITVPAAPLAASLVVEAALLVPRAWREETRSPGRRLLRAGGAGLLVAGAVLASGVPWGAPNAARWFTAPRPGHAPDDDGLVALLRRHGERGRWVVTDQPMYAFRAGLLVPPPLVVWSQKRVVAGLLKPDEVIEIVRSSRCTQVLLGRFRSPPLEDWVAARYRVAYEEEGRRLYVLPPFGPGTPAWAACLRQPATWYGGDEALRVADNVVRHQRVCGGWPKNVDMAAALAPEAPSAAGGTFDNGATTSQLRFLARVVAATNAERLRASFLRGLDWLLEAQYASGGWPQVFPPPAGSYQALATLNDGVTVRCLELVRDVRDAPTFDFVDPERRARAAEAFRRGLAFVLRTQVVVDGVRTAWCQQYDPGTLDPRPARIFELVGLASVESAAVLRLLMSLEAPAPDVVLAIQAGVAWLARVRLSGLRVAEPSAPSLPRGFDRVVVEDPTAQPLWARFYEMGTNRPFFVGRSGVKRASLAEIDAERRSGYDYYSVAPGALLGEDYPAWQRRWAPGTNALAAGR